MQGAGRLGTKHQRLGNATELYDVEDPGPNDVLFGRGTGSNMHPGNIRFRALIQKYKPVYRDTPKKMKPSVSTKVVAIWRNQSPPGRFLTRSDRFHGSRRTYYDVGDAMARRKAAQCLREKSSKERLSHAEKDGDKDTLPEADASVDDLDIANHIEEECLPGEETSLLSVLGGSLRATINDQDAEEQGDDEALPEVSLSGGLKDITSVHDELMNNDVLPNLPPGLIRARVDFDEEKIISSSGKADSTLDTSSKLMPFSLKAMTQATDSKNTKDFAWLGAGSPKNDPMSLIDTYTSNLEDDAASQEDRNGNSDSPFLFASFDLGSGGGGDNKSDDGGLCFPSLIGGDGTSSSSLFGSTSGLSSFFDDSNDTPLALPFPAPAVPAALPKNTKQNALQDIRDRMPTAANLTMDIFDF